MAPSVAFVTPSYRLDRDRCALLNRSLEACATSFEHWIVVDRGDVSLFRALENSRTHVVAKEEVLPRWVHRVDTLKIGLRSNVWLQCGGRPIRGWLLQQMVKLAIAETLTTDVVVHADSDVVLTRPFSADAVVDKRGRVRLYERSGCVDETLADHVRWHRSAETLLRVSPAAIPMPDFISSLVPWKRENAVALLEHVERTTGRHWLPAIAAAWHVSEYTLYGRFVQDVLGPAGGQFVSASPLCLDYYKRVPLTATQLTTFLERVSGDAIAVSLTSKAGMTPDDYVELLEQQWALPVRARGDSDAREGDRELERMPAAAGGSKRKGVPPLPVPRAPRHAVRNGVRFGTRDGWVTTVARRAAMALAISALLILMLVLLGLGID